MFGCPRNRGNFSWHPQRSTQGGTATGIGRLLLMMNDGMMWGMGVGHLLVIIVLLLVIAALVKYVFFR